MPFRAASDQNSANWKIDNEGEAEAHIWSDWALGGGIWKWFELFKVVCILHCVYDKISNSNSFIPSYNCMV